MEDVESGEANSRWRRRRLDGCVCGPDRVAGSHPVEFR